MKDLISSLPAPLQCIHMGRVNTQRANKPQFALCSGIWCTRASPWWKKKGEVWGSPACYLQRDVPASSGCGGDTGWVQTHSSSLEIMPNASINKVRHKHEQMPAMQKLCGQPRSSLSVHPVWSGIPRFGFVAGKFIQARCVLLCFVLFFPTSDLFNAERRW